MNKMLVGTLILSKIFYISLFSMGGFNFTLSDVCFVLFLARIAIRFFTSKEIRDVYSSDLYYYLRRMLIFAVAALMLNIGTTMAAGGMLSASVLHIFKRWLSMMVIPFYFCSCVKSKERIIWICIGTMMVYALVNYQSITTSNATRYYAEGEFNPNILSALFGLTMVYILASKYNKVVKVVVSAVSFFMIFACSSRGAVISVGMTIVIFRLFTLDKSDALAKIMRIVGFAVLGVLGIYAVSRIIPAASKRIFESFTGGITNVGSFQGRMGTARQTFWLWYHHPKLALFGTGFGNRNQEYILSMYGDAITTSDNMYIDMACWCGFIGLPLVFFYLKELFMLSYKIGKRGFDMAFIITIYMLCLGLTQSAIFEPTVGGIYYILLSMEIVKAMDAEMAEKSVAKAEAESKGEADA